MNSSNIQTSTSREAPNLKLQTGAATFPLEAWSLKFLWSLEVGAWNFFRPFAFANPRITNVA